MRAPRTRGQSACRRARWTCRSCDEWRQPRPYVQPVVRLSKKHEVSCCISAPTENPAPAASRATSAMDAARLGLSRKVRKTNVCEPKHLSSSLSFFSFIFSSLSSSLFSLHLSSINTYLSSPDSGPSQLPRSPGRL